MATKTPLYNKLETMIETIQWYQDDFKGRRIPVYEKGNKFYTKKDSTSRQNLSPGLKKN